MNEIEKLDISELKKKDKKFKFPIKKTILGIVVSLLAISSVPNLEYEMALRDAKNNDFIEKVMESDQSKEEKINQIFEEAINSNDNLDDNCKKKVISSFEDEVVDKNGYLFTKETIINMYAVAKTERIKKMSNFSAEHGWWSGDYVSYLNTYTLYDSVENTSSDIIAHEQLHAILKNGFIGSGFYKFVFHGYGINEGATSFFSKDGGYDLLKYYVDTLGVILGYDNVLKYYVNGDLSGLKKEINKYLSPKDTNKFIKNLDILVYSDYLSCFLEKNVFDENNSRLNRLHDDKLIETQRLLTQIFENKYNTKVEDSEFGKLLFDVYYCNIDPNFDLSGMHYDFNYYDKDNVLFSIYSFSIDGLFSVHYNEDIDYYKERDKIEKQIAEDLGVDKVSISGAVRDGSTYLKLNSISYKIPSNEVSTYDYDRLINQVNSFGDSKKKSLY